MTKNISHFAGGISIRRIQLLYLYLENVINEISNDNNNLII